MKWKSLLPLVMLVMLSGCQAREPQTPEETGEMPYGKWGFAFFTPYALSAVVTRALIIDSEQVVSTFRTLDPTRDDPNSIGIWYSRLSLFPHFNKARHPPAMMLFCWDSIIDKKTYQTQIIFQRSLREVMLTPIGVDRMGNTAWYKTMLFGLAPEGKVRIWLQSIAGDNLAVEPKNIITLSGDKLGACKGINQHPNGYVYYGDTPEFIKGKTYPYGKW